MFAVLRLTSRLQSLHLYPTIPDPRPALRSCRFTCSALLPQRTTLPLERPEHRGLSAESRAGRFYNSLNLSKYSKTA